MRKLLSGAAIAALVMSGTAVAKPVTHDEFGEMVREYLRENPEVIVESVELYQEKLREDSMSKVRDVIEENYDAIANNALMGAVGDDDAAITVVEFFDYNCSACKFMFNTIDTVHKNGADDVRFVFYEYPIFGEMSDQLAKIGMAVNALAPDEYYDFHASMMRHKGQIKPDQAYAYAKKLGISRDDIQGELSNTKYSTVLNDSRILADKLNVRGTPYLIVGKEPVPNALNVEKLEALLAEIRKK